MASKSRANMAIAERLLTIDNHPLLDAGIFVSAFQEPLDPVRVLTNRSSGKQGYALAQAALDAGAQVTLITTPVAVTPPVGARLFTIETAEQMLDCVLTESTDSDALIMAAAVADFRPKTQSKDKIKKEGGIPQIELPRRVSARAVLPTSVRPGGNGRNGGRGLVGFHGRS